MKPWTRSLMPRRVPYIAQLDMAECGAACLAMVLAHYGRNTAIAELREACGVSRDGVSAGAVVRVARAYGLQATGLRTDLPGLRDVPLPAILHWELSHFVVLERLTRSGAVILDPASGRRNISHDELSAGFTGVALVLKPTPQLAKRAAAPLGVSASLSALASFRKSWLLVLGSALLLELLGVCLPIGNQLLVDHVLRPQREGWFWPVSFTLIAAALLRLSLTWLRAYTLRSLSYGIDVSLMSRFVAHLVDLPGRFFAQRSVGDLMQRVGANRQLRALGYDLTLAGLDGLLVLIYGALMLAYDLQLGAIVLALSVLSIGVAHSARRRLEEVGAQEVTARGREHASVVEAFSMPELVKAIGAEGRLAQRFAQRSLERVNATLRLKSLASTWGNGLSALDGLCYALVLWCGGQKVIAGDMSFGVYAGFLALQGLVRDPLSALVAAFSQLSYAKNVFARMQDVMQSDREREGGIVLGDLTGRVDVEHLSFRHGPTSSWVCNDINFSVAPGEIVAIVGKSGSGKSTLGRLLLGMLAPSQGAVRWDGVALDQLDLQSLRRQIGVVSQDPALFTVSVGENMTLGDETIETASLRRAARLACLEDVIDALPKGYDQILTQRGACLSGGQRQRMALARALARHPKVLILDEATSSLDPALEAKVHQHLATLSCTRIVIAHRLSTVQHADRIFVLDQGQLVQQGKFNDLMAQPGPFAALAHALWSGR